MHGITVLAWIAPFVVGTAVAFRILYKRLHQEGCDTGDWLLIGALLFYIPYSATTIVAIHTFLHNSMSGSLPSGALAVLGKCLTSTFFTFAPALALVKASFIRSLTCASDARFVKIAGLMMHAYVAAWAVTAIFVGSFTCRPFAKSWNPELSGQCANRTSGLIAIAALDIVSYIGIFLLALPVLWKSRPATTGQAKIAATMIVGIATLIVSILRLVGLTQPSAFGLEFAAIVHSWTWSVLEPPLAFLVACIFVHHPAVHPRVNPLHTRVAAWVGSAKAGTSRSVSATESSATLENDFHPEWGNKCRTWVSRGSQAFTNFTNEDLEQADADTGATRRSFRTRSEQLRCLRHERIKIRRSVTVSREIEPGELDDGAIATPQRSTRSAV